MADFEPAVSWPWENSFQPASASPDPLPATPLAEAQPAVEVSPGQHDLARAGEAMPGIEDKAESKLPQAEFSPEGKSRFDKLLDELEGNRSTLAAMYQERNRRMNPIYDEVLNALKERGKVQMPPLQPLPQPPSYQSHVNSARNDFLGLAVFFGALGLGRRTAGGMTTALTAFAGISEGLAKGDKERAGQEMERWKAAMDYTIKSNKQITDQYKTIIESEKDSLDTKLAMLKLEAARFDDPIGQKLAEQGNIMDIAKFVAQNENAQVKGEILRLQIDKLHQAIKGAQEKLDKGNNASMTEEQLNELVDEYHATGRRPQLSVFGFRQAGDANRRAFQELLTERIKTENWGPDWQRKAASDWAGDISGARSAGIQAANLDLILRKVEVAIPIAEAASRNVPRHSLVPLNELQLRGEAAISDSRVRDFAIKNLQVAELWAAAMNPRGQMRLEDRHLALQQLQLADSQDTYSTALAAVKQFVIRERKAVQGFREHTPVQEESGLPSPATPQTPRAGPPPAAVQYLKAHPELRGEFDSKYGQGAAEKVLGGQ